MSTVAIVVITEEDLRRIIREELRELRHLTVEPPPALVDRAGLARSCCVSAATVDRWVRSGCPVVRIGTSPRFEVAEVLQWLKRRTNE